MREREDDVDVGHVEQLALAGLEPALPRLRLTLRTVAITARNGVHSITCLMGSNCLWGVRYSKWPRLGTRPVF